MFCMQVTTISPILQLVPEMFSVVTCFDPYLKDWVLVSRIGGACAFAREFRYRASLVSVDH